MDDAGGESQSSTKFTSRASWPSLKKSDKPPSLDTPQSEDEELEDEDEVENNDDSDN